VSRYGDAHRERLGVESICQTRQVARSTYYAVKSRKPSKRSVRDDELKAVDGEVALELASIPSDDRDVVDP
jgi:putative transposase